MNYIIPLNEILNFCISELQYFSTFAPFGGLTLARAGESSGE